MVANTTQEAILERFLASQRCKQVIPYVRNKHVLDFGCGRRAWNANTISKYCLSVDGIEHNYTSVQKVGAVSVYPDLDSLPAGKTYDAIIALAVFEHINPFVLIDILGKLSRVCNRDTIIIGTVPTPLARPILEFLSYRLGLIDSSQIKDHKVYYDELWLSSILAKSNWKLISYKTFQIGLNSRFVLKLR